MNTTATVSRRLDTERLSELVARVDLSELVAHFAGGPGRRSGRTETFSCPNPSHADRNPSFSVSTTPAGKQTARCFSLCGWRGDALDLVEWLTGLRKGEAAEWLRAWLGDAPKKAPKVKAAAPKPDPRPVTPLEVVEGETSPEAAEFLSKYLRHRGWPESVVERFALSVVRDTYGEFRVRHPYLSPVPGGEWAVTYWQDRGPKYARSKWLSSPGAQPVLYNLRSLEAKELSGVVVCEGPADTITAALALDGLPVAVVGVPGVAAWRTEWARYLDGLPVVLALDSDTAGQRLAEKLRAELGSRRVVTLELPEKDLTDTAAEHGLDDLRKLLRGALSVAGWSPVERKAVRLVLDTFPGSTVEGVES